MLSVVLAILIFGLIIVVHEFGHFVAAKLNDISVLEFAIGMGPAFFKKQFGETQFSLRVFPIGGFCKMLGEDEDADDPRAFSRKKVWQRFTVSVSGALMNFLLAFVICLIIVFVNGYSLPVISEVISGSPAESSGLMAGDTIKKANGMAVNTYNDLTFVISLDGGKPVRLQIVRGGQKIEKEITPQYVEAEDRYIIGIYATYKYALFGGAAEGGQRAGLLDSVSAGFYQMLSYIKFTVVSLTRFATLQFGIDKMSGPIGVTSFIGEQISQAGDMPAAQKFLGILQFCAVLAAALSANVGVFNLLPLPALDGGRCIFLFVEWIRKKPIDPNKEGLVHFIGFILLMVLAVFVAFSDILKIL